MLSGTLEKLLGSILILNFKKLANIKSFDIFLTFIGLCRNEESDLLIN